MPDTTTTGPSGKPKVGGVIGDRFQILRECATGGGGTVFEASDTILDSKVALKFRHRNVPRMSYVDEARKAKKITHPNVCRIYDLHEIDEYVFISMEYLERSLETLLDSRKPSRLSISEIELIGQQICAGLEAIHRHGLYHQDLKPANVMIDADGKAKVSDLGFVGSRAKGFNRAYMAPEQAHMEVSIQSDLYSLGAMLYEMLTGERPPSDGEKRHKLLADHRDLREAVLQCLAEEPKARPASAIEVARALAGEVSSKPRLFNIRHDERKESDKRIPLRTKIVATIGDEHSYERGLVLPDGTTIPPGEVGNSMSLYRLADKFAESGVDVIRLDFGDEQNLDEVRRKFVAIRLALLARETRLPKSKPIAVLADLPGPRICLELGAGEVIEPRVGQHFTVHLTQKPTRPDECTVRIDGRPLKEVLENPTIVRPRAENSEIDRLVELVANRARTEDESPEADVENILGLRRSAPRDYPKFVRQLQQRLTEGGVHIYIGNGEVMLDLERIMDSGTVLRCRVVSSKKEKLEGNHALAFKGVNLNIPTFTEWDQKLTVELLREDWADGEENQVLAFLGLSFTQTADDVLRARHFIEDLLVQLGISREKARLGSPGIITKIETSEGWRNRNHILDVADGVLAARGAHAFRGAPELDPEMQKRLILLGNKRGKPVITATQKPSGTAGSDEPTHPDAFAVFNAIQDGTDAVLLSVETSKGSHPFHAIKNLIQIASRAEYYFELKGLADRNLRRDLRRDRLLGFMADDYERIEITERRLANAAVLIADWRLRLGTPLVTRPKKPATIEIERMALEWRHQLFSEKWEKARKQEITNRITESACLLAEATVMHAIITASTSGRTTRMVSRMRPRVEIIGAAHDRINTRKLAISYGVLPVCIGVVEGGGIDALFQRCRQEIIENEPLREILEDRELIFTGGTPLGRPGTTNTIQALRLSRDLEPPGPGATDGHAGNHEGGEEEKVQQAGETSTTVNWRSRSPTSSE